MAAIFCSLVILLKIKVKSLVFINELFGIFSFFDLCFYRYAQEKNTAIRKSHYHLAFAYHSKN